MRLWLAGVAREIGYIHFPLMDIQLIIPDIYKELSDVFVELSDVH